MNLSELMPAGAGRGGAGHYQAAGCMVAGNALEPRATPFSRSAMATVGTVHASPPLYGGDPADDGLLDGCRVEETGGLVVSDAASAAGCGDGRLHHHRNELCGDCRS